MPKCDFTSAWVFPYKFAAYFQNTFSQDTSENLKRTMNDIARE